MSTVELVPNRSAAHGAPLTADEAAIVGGEAPAVVRSFLGAFPDHAETPLVELPALARELGLGGLWLKDEGGRYGLKSFKALGGAYAVARLVARHLEARLGRRVDPGELRGAECRNIAAEMTVCCATDGNHGRSVAAGAQAFGCNCVIFVHAGVSEQRAQAIAAFGARIVRTEGNYDDSVAAATEAAEREGWTTVSDMSWEGYTEVPGLVMQGYALMTDEILAQAPGPFSHVFVQGGVGGLAAAVAGQLHDRLGADKPRVVVVEPIRANCLQRSAMVGERQSMPAGESTIMAMLECYEPSLIAWAILEKTADDFLAIPDDSAVEAMRRLAHPTGGDPRLEIGESGAAGLAALLALTPELRQRLGLDETSRVLVLGTEGATDPELFARLTA